MVDLAHPTHGAASMPSIPGGAVTNAAAAPLDDGFVLAGGFSYGANGRDGMSNSVWRCVHLLCSVFLLLLLLLRRQLLLLPPPPLPHLRTCSVLHLLPLSSLARFL
jgi:hypothetical protein